MGEKVVNIVPPWLRSYQNNTVNLPLGQLVSPWEEEPETQPLPVVSEMRPKSNGCSCTRCKEFHAYAEKPENAEFFCYACRQNPYR